METLLLEFEFLPVKPVLNYGVSLQKQNYSMNSIKLMN